MISGSVSASLRASRPWAASATRAVSTTRQSAAVTNLAARLCGEADAGQVLVSQRVFSAVEDLAVGESVGALELRGFSRPIRAFGVSRMINSSAEVPS